MLIQKPSHSAQPRECNDHPFVLARLPTFPWRRCTILHVITQGLKSQSILVYQSSHILVRSKALMLHHTGSGTESISNQRYSPILKTMLLLSLSILFLVQDYYLIMCTLQLSLQLNLSWFALGHWQFLSTRLKVTHFEHLTSF